MSALQPGHRWPPLSKAALAADLPTIKWRLASSFPKSLDTIYGAADVFYQAGHGEATGGKFEIRPFAGGEIVPAFSVMDSVKDGTVECGHTASYYTFGKDPTFALDCAVPSGLNFRQFAAWTKHGGGLELLREFFATHNITNFPMGNTGAQMGGWFRKEIKTVKDLDGLKFRVGALPARCWLSSARCPSRFRAATSISRSRRAPSTPRNGSAPTMTRSSASTRSRRSTTILAGGKAVPTSRSISTRSCGTVCPRSIRRSSSQRQPKPTST